MRVMVRVAGHGKVRVWVWVELRPMGRKNTT